MRWSDTACYQIWRARGDWVAAALLWSVDYETCTVYTSDCWWSMSSVWCDSWPDWRCAVRSVLVSATTDQPDCGAAAPAPAGVLNSCNVVDRSSMNGPLLCNLSSVRKKDSVSGKRCCKGERSLSGIHESDLIGICTCTGVVFEYSFEVLAVISDNKSKLTDDASAFV